MLTAHAEKVGFELFGFLVHLFADKVDSLEFVPVLVGDLPLLLLFCGLELLLERLVDS